MRCYAYSVCGAFGRSEPGASALFLDAGLFLLALVVAIAGTISAAQSPELLRALVALKVAALVALLPVANALWHMLMSAGPADGSLDFK